MHINEADNFKFGFGRAVIPNTKLIANGVKA